MDWIPITLICAFSLASADALIKARLSDYSARELAFVRLTLTGLITAPMLLVETIPSLPIEFWYWVGAILPIEITAMLLYNKAICRYPLGETLPYLAFTPVFTILTGYMLLGERLPMIGILGILLVVVGAWLLNLKRSHLTSWRGLVSPFIGTYRHPGSMLMLLVAFLYSLTAVGGKGALQYMEPAQFGPFYFLLVGGALIPILGFSRPRMLLDVWRKPWPVLATAGLMGVMLITHFIALRMTEVAYMIAVKRTSLVFGVIFGAILFKEAGLGNRLIAVAVMLCGVGLIAYN